MANEIRLNDFGFVRVGAAVPRIEVADVDFNVARMIECMNEALAKRVKILVFPELAVTGYTCQDLFLQKILLDKAEEGLSALGEATINHTMVVVVGMPVRAEGKLLNCAVVLQGGRILGIVPKMYLPNYKEFYEKRWFSSAIDLRGSEVTLCGEAVPIGADILFRAQSNPNVCVGIEICEDLWVAPSPHEFQAHEGATIMLNLSASNEVVGKADWRRSMVEAASGMSYGAYMYVSCGVGESSNDVVFGGHAIIAENGTILKESERFSQENQVIVQDIDIDRLSYERRLIETFNDGVVLAGKAYRTVDFSLADTSVSSIERFIDAHPFVPSNSVVRDERCKEVFSIQVAGLAKKLKGAKTDRVVLGVSGGLDSTLAALVLGKTMDYLGVSRTNASVFTMPGFGTTKRTKNNALRLARSLGLTVATVDIAKSAVQHLKDLKRDPKEDDVTSQNVQARYRTEFLFNEANAPRAIVLGTGDLTEIALGWCTFSGDHMSHYHVNASVPKTLVKYLVRWVAETQVDGKTKKVLIDILDTPISPELTRSKSGKVEQKSEDYVGPFELADFYLYHFIRTGSPPSKILSFANVVNERGLFDARYTLEELKKWLASFITRFFSNQFKRTCMPEGPKVGSVSLSPRGDWRMPSDASLNVWLQDLEKGYAKMTQGGIKE